MASSGTGVENILPLLSIFDLLRPWRNDPNRPGPRVELYRRSGRHLDLSAAIRAGELVVCGIGSINGETNKNPLPVPLTVSDYPSPGRDDD